MSLFLLNFAIDLPVSIFLLLSQIQHDIVHLIEFLCFRQSVLILVFQLSSLLSLLECAWEKKTKFFYNAKHVRVHLTTMCVYNFVLQSFFHSLSLILFVYALMWVHLQITCMTMFNWIMHVRSWNYCIPILTSRKKCICLKFLILERGRRYILGKFAIYDESGTMLMQFSIILL